MWSLSRISFLVKLTIGNIIIMLICLVLVNDKLERLVSPWSWANGCLKIAGSTIISVLFAKMWFYFIKLIGKPLLKIKHWGALLITLIVSMNFYFDFCPRLVNNIILNQSFRNKIATSIKTSLPLAYGTSANNLTLKAYQEISFSNNRFFILPSKATNINYSYNYDGFLPDFSFYVSYDLPKQLEIDTFSRRNDGFINSQSYEVVGSKKRVTYKEVRL